MKKTILLFAFLFICGISLSLAQEDQIIFSHAYHIDEVGAACTDCHGAVESSTSPSDNLLPAMETCYTCHDEDDTECSVCHTNPDEPGPLPRIISMNARFSHETHLAAGKTCLDCHQGIEEETKPAGGASVPGRDLCMDCHEQADYTEQKEVCYTCHSKDMGFRPQNHLANWKKDHGVSWQIQQKDCRHCHSNDFCMECHEGDNLDRLAHPLNYRHNHGIDARANKENCITCHRDLSFCNDCHQMEMVMPNNHSYAGWSNRTNGGLHARAAQMDFDYCQTCHSDLTGDVVCITCHGK
jgi:nitrate/TMAO reductase-like tetraheme cytochrome c subunit